MTSTTSAATTKLSDTQLILLSQAAQHPERALAIPDRLRGGALARVVGPLLAKGLVEIVPHRGDLPVYKTEADGSRTALLITNTGLLAVGIEPEPATEDQSNAGSAEVASAAEDSDKAPRTRRPREGTKQQMLIAMLRRPEGATVPRWSRPPAGCAHGSGRHRRRTQEEAQAPDQLGKGRGAQARLPHRLSGSVRPVPRSGSMPLAHAS
jgi:hypothetical protein